MIEWGPEEAQRLIEGEGGDRLGEVGIMTALVGADGRIHVANRAFRARSSGDNRAEGLDFVSLFNVDAAGVRRFRQEGASATALRLLQMPLGATGVDGATIEALWRGGVHHVLHALGA